MDNLVVNAVAPWTGYLHWVGNVRKGNGKKGPYAFADFTLRYTSTQMQEKFITFSISGEDNVELIENSPIGTPLKVHWFPDTAESQDAGRWYPKLAAFNVSVIKDVPPPSHVRAEKITAPSYPEKREPEAWKNPLPKEDRSYSPDDTDLPFN